MKDRIDEKSEKEEWLANWVILATPKLTLRVLMLIPSVLGLAAIAQSAANAQTIVTFVPSAVQGPDTRPCGFVKPIGANFWYALPMTVTFATDFELMVAATSSGKHLQVEATGQTVSACPDLTTGLPYPEVRFPLLLGE